MDAIGDDGGDFEFSTRSKTRKAKVDQSKAGEISRPISLELNKFKTPPNNNSNEDRASKSAGAKVKKILINKTKGPLHMLASDNSIKGKTAHLTEWDQPKQTSSSDDAFSELAKQTEIFAQKHRRQSCDRPTSYSEIVSDGNRHKMQPSPPAVKLTPIGTPELEKKTYKHPGTIGQRLPNTPKSSTPSVNGGSWGTILLSPATPQTPTTPSGPLFPSDLRKDGENSLDGCLDLPRSDKLNDETFPMFSGQLPLAGLWEPNTNWQDQCRSRRGSDDWNSFGVNLLPNGNLWDADFNSESNNLWPPKDMFGYSSLTPKNSANNNSTFEPSPYVWGPVWPNKNARTKSASSEGTSFDESDVNSPSTLSVEKASDTKESTCPEFDPFRTPHNIWSPTSASSSPTSINQDSENNNRSWAFSLFSNKNLQN